MHKLFINEHSDLEGIIKYHFYYTYFKKNFDYAFGRPQVDVCNQCECLVTKMKDPNLSANAKRNVAAELIIHKRAKKFYVKLKNATENTDDNTTAYASIICKIYHYQTYRSRRFFICVSFGSMYSEFTT